MSNTLETNAQIALSECDTINFHNRPVHQLQRLNTPVEVSGDMLATIKQAQAPYNTRHVKHRAATEAAEHRLENIYRNL